MILIVMITILITKRKMRAVVPSATLAVLLLLTGCGSDAGETEELHIVATTSIWGDMVENLVRDDASVAVLMPIGTDAHDFEPTSVQVASLQAADLVIANGLGLEETMEDTLEGAVADGANVYAVAPDLEPLPFSANSHPADDQDGEESDEHDGDDPHVWFDPLRMATAAGLIAERLAEVDDSIDWQERAAAYAAELVAADEEISRIVSAIDPGKRKLVTNHEALGYFAERYGFEILGVVIPGGSTLADPSSADLAELVEEIEHENVHAVFAETSQPTRLAEAVAAEVGRDISVVELYTESLGETGSDADSLVGLLVTDARLIAGALTR
jgi:zinc/manganese transport system substrate-binding protein